MLIRQKVFSARLATSHERESNPNQDEDAFKAEILNGLFVCKPEHATVDLIRTKNWYPGIVSDTRWTVRRRVTRRECRNWGCTRAIWNGRRSGATICIGWTIVWKRERWRCWMRWCGFSGMGRWSSFSVMRPFFGRWAFWFICSMRSRECSLWFGGLGVFWNLIGDLECGYFGCTYIVSF